MEKLPKRTEVTKFWVTPLETYESAISGVTGITLGLLCSPIEGCTARPSRHNESTITSLGEQQAEGDPRQGPHGKAPKENRSHQVLGYSAGDL
jgi:hypothetical protein